MKQFNREELDAMNTISTSVTEQGATLKLKLDRSRVRVFLLERKDGTASCLIDRRDRFDDPESEWHLSEVIDYDSNTQAIKTTSETESAIVDFIRESVIGSDMTQSEAITEILWEVDFDGNEFSRDTIAIILSKSAAECAGCGAWNDQENLDNDGLCEGCAAECAGCGAWNDQENLDNDGLCEGCAADYSELPG